MQFHLAPVESTKHELIHMHDIHPWYLTSRNQFKSCSPMLLGQMAWHYTVLLWEWILQFLITPF